MRALRYALAAIALWVGLLSGAAHAQTPTRYTVTGNLSGVSSSSTDQLQIRFNLANCGAANPAVGTTTTLVPKSQVFNANASGTFTGQLWGNDQITCNLGFSTVYDVTLLRNNVPTGVVSQYRVTNPLAQTPAVTAWNFNTAIPLSTLPAQNLPASGFNCPAGLTMTGLQADWTPTCSPVTTSGLAGILAAPSASQSILQPAGTTLQISSLNNTLNADAFLPGTPDIGAKIVAAAKQLGGPGQVTVNTPGVIAQGFVTPDNVTVFLNAPLTWKGPIIVGNNSSVVCLPGMVQTLGPGVAELAAQINTVNGTFDGCNVKGDPATPGAYMLYVSGSTTSGVTVRNMHGTGVGVITTGDVDGSKGVSNVTVENSSSVYPTTAFGNAAGAYLFYVNGGTITGNTFSHTYHGVQWWGGNAAGYGIGGATGNLTISHNRCDHQVGSCVWGSNGHDIVVSDNTSDTTGDVAFDTEGGLRVRFHHNTASSCGNGCGAWFFADQDISFDGNVFDGTGSNAFFTRNNSQNPSTVTGAYVRGNTITCSAVCNAAYIEAASNVSFDDNDITNGVFLAASYGSRAYSISKNRFRFTVAPGAGQAIISAPGMLGGSLDMIEGNVLWSSFGTGVGIAASSPDFNNQNFTIVRGNTITGFQTGISTNSNGGNGGVPTTWTLERNVISAAVPIAHTAPNPNENYTVLDNRDLFGAGLAANNIGQLVIKTATPTAATVGATSVTPVSFPNVAGKPYAALCTLYATSGAPSLMSYSGQTGGTINVTIQATTAAAAGGTIVCQQVHN